MINFKASVSCRAERREESLNFNEPYAFHFVQDVRMTKEQVLHELQAFSSKNGQRERIASFLFL
jgi:hypothetical protein